MNKAWVLRENSKSLAEEAFSSKGYRSRHAIVSVLLAHKWQNLNLHGRTWKGLLCNCPQGKAEITKITGNTFSSEQTLKAKLPGSVAELQSGLYNKFNIQLVLISYCLNFCC